MSNTLMATRHAALICLGEASARAQAATPLRAMVKNKRRWQPKVRTRERFVLISG